MSRTKDINDLSASYKLQKETGLSSVTILIPTAAKETLEAKADQRGLTLASYCRGILLGTEYQTLKKHKIALPE